MQVATREELIRRRGDPQLTIVDALPRESFDEAHIPGAVSLPVEEVEARARQVLPDLAADIIVYCGGPT